MLAAVARLRDEPVSADMLQRARQPMIETIDNALKTNRGWLSVTARAQSEADRTERFVRTKQRLLDVTPLQLQAAARRYLTQAGGVEVLVLPEPPPPPKQ